MQAAQSVSGNGVRSPSDTSLADACATRLNINMNSLELRASVGLAGLYGLRMLGMFLVLPVFALYATALPGGDNHALIGIALGSYGLTQALLQLPFGMLSDRIGRKKVIYAGLLLFAAGSFVAAVTALLADLTREENRTKAMAMIGMTIGTTFAASLVLAPLLTKWIGVNGIFALTGVLTLLAMIGVKFIIPDPSVSRFHSDTEANTARLPVVLRDPQLLRLNFGILALHASQMAMFVVMPFALIQTAGLDKTHHWEVYLPVTLIGFLLMVPAIIYGEKRQQLKPVFVGAVALMFIAQLGMAFALDSFWEIVVLLGLYFIAFNILEACLPSLISKIAPTDAKGTAIGVYNTAQSIGLFLGAAIGGWLYSYAGSGAVFGFTSILIGVWLTLAISMAAPMAVRTEMFHIGEDWQGDAAALSSRLSSQKGVKEAVVIASERVAYLKVMQNDWDRASVNKLIEETY